VLTVVCVGWDERSKFQHGDGSMLLQKLMNYTHLSTWHLVQWNTSRTSYTFENNFLCNEKYKNIWSQHFRFCVRIRTGCIALDHSQFNVLALDHSKFNVLALDYSKSNALHVIFDSYVLHKLKYELLIVLSINNKMQVEKKYSNPRTPLGQLILMCTMKSSLTTRDLNIWSRDLLKTERRRNVIDIIPPSLCMLSSPLK
jgi:hypothetical protein